MIKRTDLEDADSILMVLPSFKYQYQVRPVAIIASALNVKPTFTY